MPPDDTAEQDVPPSSRLCVKNIPKYVDEARLKEFFSAKGEVTDVKVLRTKDGRSRQLGFIGFKSVEDAATALKYYNRSYMDTMRLDVEYARKVGDDQLPRAWSKHTVGTSANRKLTGASQPAAQQADGKDRDGKKGAKKAGKDVLLPGEEEDEKLREFLALMQPRSKAKIWANDVMQQDDDTAAPAAPAAAATRQPQPQTQKKQQQQPPPGEKKKDTGQPSGGGPGGDEEDDGEEEDGDYQDWTREAVGRSGRGAAGGRAGCSGIGDDEEEEEVEDGGELEDEGGGGGRRGAVDGVVVDEAVSDLEYLRSRMRRWDEEEEEEQQEEEDDQDGAAAARGDQSGVGTSPHCAAGAAVTAALLGDKKATKVQAAAAAAAAAQDLKKKQKGVKEGKVSRDAGGGSKDQHGGNGDPDAPRNGDVEMAEAEAGAEEEGRGLAERRQRPKAGGEPTAAAEDDDIMDTGRLFVRNLAYTATETDLSDLFGAHGDLQEVHLVLDRETKRSKGLAYVQFQIPEDAVRAAQQLDGTIYQGRLLHILPAKKAPGAGAGPGGAASALASSAGEGAEADGQGADAAGDGRPGTSSFKAQREAQRKADAGNRAAWNTLFMRSDTVAEAVAAHYGLSKAALLDASTSGSGGGGGAGDSVAVRMALGEAQVIAATKLALAETGVSVEALERAAAASGKASASKAVQRSSTTLLVKNLPFSADEDELAELFGRCGPVARLVLPPARALALVEFAEPQDARGAFRSLAYKKYHHVPLYLEWAPADVFTGPPAAKPPQQQQPRSGDQQQAAATKKAGGKGAKAAPTDVTAAADHAAAAAAADGGGGGDGGGAVNPNVVGTIYVKNLAFATGDSALRKHFDSVVSAAGGSLHSAVVAKKKAKDGAVQSLGYGFVEVDSEAVAAAVIKTLQGSMLEGHKLALQLSKGRPGGAAAGGKKAGAGGAKKAGAAAEEGSTKLVVRNLAFEATKKDIQGLFNPFGHLKSCRLPKKFDGSHRGFAFVEFVTKQEARNALEGAGGTHLYGRRLVVEYAREDDGLDELRNKTAAKFKRGEEAEAGADIPAKRLKL